MNPQISIIIPVYRVENYIARCLDSILPGAECGNVEVIIVDDGSPDRSGEIADRYAFCHPFIQVIHRENEGVASARNAGLSLARGKWLYFVDSDDWLAEGATDILLRKSAEAAEADIILFDAWKNTGERETLWEHFREETSWEASGNGRSGIRQLQRGALYFPAMDRKTSIPLAAPWDKLYRRRFLLEHEIHFNQELKVLDDMIFNMTAFGKARRVVYFKEKIYHYRYVPESITNSYRADRVIQDMRVWNYLSRYMVDSFQKEVWEEEEKDSFRQAYYCRVIKSFSICCRLAFFHPENRKKLPAKIADVREVLKMEPYWTAFHNVRLARAEWRLKAVICLGRIRSGAGIYFLHRMQRLADFFSDHGKS